MRAISYTSLSCYRTCPLQYKLRYIEKLPEKAKPFFSFGTVLHEAAEFFNTAPGAPGLDTLLSFYEGHWLSDGYESKEDEKAHKALGRQMLTTFWELHAKDHAPPLAAELRFNTKMRGIPVTGFVDLVRRLPDGKLEILDYKSGKSAPTMAQVKANDQLLMYQIAVKEAYGKDIGRLTIYHMRSNTAISVPPHTKEEAEAFLDSLEDVARGIESGHFEPVENDFCPCDWPGHCPFYKEAYKDSSDQSKLEDHGPGAVDIDTVVAEYLSLKDKAKEEGERLEELEAAIKGHCRERGVRRVFSKDRQVTLFHGERSGFDKEAVQKALKGTPHLAAVSEPAPKKVEELLEDSELPAKLKKALLAARTTSEYDYLRVGKRKDLAEDDPIGEESKKDRDSS